MAERARCPATSPPPWAQVLAWAGATVGVVSVQEATGKELRIDMQRLQGVRGAKEGAGIVAARLLPHSRLLVAGAEDGRVLVCC